MRKISVYPYTQREIKWTDTEGAAEAHFMLQHTGSKRKELAVVAQDKLIFCTETCCQLLQAEVVLVCSELGIHLGKNSEAVLSEMGISVSEVHYNAE